MPWSKGDKMLHALDDLLRTTRGVAEDITIEQTGDVKLRKNASQVIRTLLRQFRKYRDDVSKRQKVLQELRKKLTPDAIQMIDKDDLEGLLNRMMNFTGALRESGIDQILSNPIPKICRVLMRLLWGSESLEQRLESLLTEEEWHLKGAGLGFMTAMLYISDPSTFPLYNDPVRKGLEVLVEGASFGDTPKGYLLFKSSTHRLQREYRIPAVQIDWMLWNLSKDYE